MHNNQKIPEGWSVKKLEDCFSFLKTPSYSRTETTDSGEVRYIHYGDIHTKYHLHVCPTDIDIFVSAEQARKGDLLKTGDLILLDASEDYEGTTKCIELVDIKENDKVISGLHTLALRDNTKNFANGFRAYITSIPFVKDLFWKQVSGFKVYGVSKDNLKKLKLIFPPLAEQKKIAEILGTWDEAIEKLSSLIEQKKLLKKGLMQKLLTGKVRLKGFIQPWKEVKLGELIKQKRIVIEKGKSLTSENIVEGAIPVIAGGKTSPYSHNKFTHNKPCITISASGAYAGYVWKHITPIWASDCNVLYGTDYDTNFLGCCLEYKQQQIYQLQTGGAQPHVYATDIKIITVPNINITEQQAIADVLSTADEEIDLLNKKLEALKEQKKGLMQQLLTGNIRVKVN